MFPVSHLGFAEHRVFIGYFTPAVDLIFHSWRKVKEISAGIGYSPFKGESNKCILFYVPESRKRKDVSAPYIGY